MTPPFPKIFFGGGCPISCLTGLLFAFLADISKDPCYGFRVSYNSGAPEPAEEHPGAVGKYVVALIGSSQRSRQEQVGSGWRVITQGIIDLAHPDVTAESTAPDSAAASQRGEGKYAVVGYCTADGLLSLKLDPPRGKPLRAAVALFSTVDDVGLQIHKLEHVEPENVQHAIASFRKLRTLSARINPSSAEKRGRSVETLTSLDQTPAFKRCRSLRELPSAESLPEARGGR